MRSRLVVLSALAVFASLPLSAAPTPKKSGAPVTVKATAETVAPSGGLFKIGEDVLVTPNAHLRGAVTAVGGSARVLGAVDGDVTVIGGSADVEGPIGGDLIVLGSRARLGPSAKIGGRFITIGASIDKSDGAAVLGQTVNLSGAGFAALASSATFAGALAGLGFLLRVIATAGWLLLALVAGALLSNALTSAGARISERPILSLFAGLLFWPAVIAMGVAMLLSLIGIPFLPLLLAVAAVVSVWGYLVAGQWLGAMLLPTGAAWLPCFVGIGILQILGWLPSIGKASTLLAHLLGVGSALLFWLPRKDSY